MVYWYTLPILGVYNIYNIYTMNMCKYTYEKKKAHLHLAGFLLKLKLIFSIPVTSDWRGKSLDCSRVNVWTSSKFSENHGETFVMFHAKRGEDCSPEKKKKKQIPKRLQKFWWDITHKFIKRTLSSKEIQMRMHQMWIRKHGMLSYYKPSTINAIKIDNPYPLDRLCSPFSWFGGHISIRISRKIQERV